MTRKEFILSLIAVPAALVGAAKSVKGFEDMGILEIVNECEPTGCNWTNRPGLVFDAAKAERCDIEFKMIQPHWLEDDLEHFVPKEFNGLLDEFHKMAD